MNDVILYVQRRFSPDARDTAILAEMQAAGREVDVIVGGLSGRDWTRYGLVVVAPPTTHGDTLPDGSVLDSLPVTVASMCAATSVQHLGMATTAQVSTTDQAWRFTTDARATETTIFFPSATVEAINSLSGDVTKYYDNNATGTSIADRIGGNGYRRIHVGISSFQDTWTAATQGVVNSFLFDSIDPVASLAITLADTAAAFQASTSPTIRLADTTALLYVEHTSPLSDSDVRDIVGAAETLEVRQGINQRLQAMASTSLEQKAAFSANLTLEGLLVTALKIAELVDVTDSATMQEQVVIGLSTMRYLLAGATDSQETAVRRVAELVDEALAAGTLSVAEAQRVMDTVAALGSVAVGLRVELLDAALADLTPEYTLSISVSETLLAEAGDTVQALGHYLADITDLAGAWVTFKVSGEVIQGWVMNLEGSRPLSQYENFEFNSMAEVGGVHYAASDAGLFELGGGTDGGAQIDALLKTLMVDFDTSAQKRVVNAYLGYTSDGAVVLKVRSVDQGKLVEHWYKANEVPADSPSTNHVQLGRGLKSRYWQFELANVDGADFEIDQLEVLPLILSRRV